MLADAPNAKGIWLVPSRGPEAAEEPSMDTEWEVPISLGVNAGACVGALVPTNLKNGADGAAVLFALVQVAPLLPVDEPT